MVPRFARDQISWCSWKVYQPILGAKWTYTLVASKYLRKFSNDKKCITKCHAHLCVYFFYNCQETTTYNNIFCIFVYDKATDIIKRNITQLKTLVFKTIQTYWNKFIEYCRHQRNSCETMYWLTIHRRQFRGKINVFLNIFNEWETLLCTTSRSCEKAQAWPLARVMLCIDNQGQTIQKTQ